MDQALDFSREPRTQAEYDAEVLRILKELDEIDARGVITRASIERLKAETAEIRAQTRAILAEIGHPVS